MKNNPILMENYFSPGFKTKPAVLIGSQSMRLYRGDMKEQAWEGLFLAAAYDKDVVVVRNIESSYISYWKNLMLNPTIININGTDKGAFLTKIVSKHPSIINKIKSKMDPQSKLMVYFPTEDENKLADLINIPLHGTPSISSKYGTKIGIREISYKAKIPMVPGFICTTSNDVEDAIRSLSSKFDTVIIKHDLSSGGRWSKKVNTRKIYKIKNLLNEICEGKFIEKKDVFVVEGWIKSKHSLCAQIEILEEQLPVICAGWEQLIDTDGITYIGAVPLNISKKALDSFILNTKRLANFLKEKNAIGSYGVDFLITADDESNLGPDTSILIELNARVPVTAFPLEIIKNIKGEIGSGFFITQINLSQEMTFKEIRNLLEKHNLLITERHHKARGVVPYNIGLLAWNTFNIVAMADSWEETCKIVEKVKLLFQ